MASIREYLIKHRDDIKDIHYTNLMDLLNLEQIGTESDVESENENNLIYGTIVPVNAPPLN